MKVITIFIENNNNQFLIQKRSIQKNGKYGITSGHIKEDENNINAAIREIKEELGVDIKKEELNLFYAENKEKNDYYLYHLKKDIDINKLHLQKSEVDEAKWCKPNEIEDIIHKGEFYDIQIEALKVFQRYKKDI